MQLVCVADHPRDLPDGQAGLFEQLGGPHHPVVQKIGLGAFAHGVPEHLAEIAAVEPADLGDLLDGDVPLVVLVDEGQRLPDVEIPEPVLAAGAAVGGGLGQLVQKQKAVGDQVHRAGAAVVDDVEHLLLQQPARLAVLGGVDRLAGAQPGQIDPLVGPQPVELQPGIFPGVLLVGAVGGDLARHHQKALPGGDGVLGVVGQQHPPPGDDVVEQIVVAGVGPVGVGRGGALPAELIEVQVDEAFVPEYVEFQLGRVACVRVHT